MTTFNTSREIPATVEQVFAAFSDPERASRWWGPAGRNYNNESVFSEIESPGKIVIQHVSGPKYQLTIVLTSSPAGTVVSWSQVFESADVASRIEHIVCPPTSRILIACRLKFCAIR